MNSFPTTVGEAIASGMQRFDYADLFFGHGTDNAEDEAFWLVFYALDISFNSDDSVLLEVIDQSQWSLIDGLFSRRINERVPAAYITGQAWFCGYEFSVDDQVLVPRSPIGELIAEGFSPWLDDGPAAILDLCTGCGCIGIASALYLPNSRVDLSDISDGAITMAEKNIQRHQLSDRVKAVKSDLFGALVGQRYDLIVSNPPYVDADDLAAMPSEYQAEPAIALGSGSDGLDITRRLLREAANYLNDDGIMIVEVGNSGENLEAAFPRVPFVWIEFAYGGHGVFVISKQELEAYRAEFA